MFVYSACKQTESSKLTLVSNLSKDKQTIDYVHLFSFKKNKKARKMVVSQGQKIKFTNYILDSNIELNT